MSQRIPYASNIRHERVDYKFMLTSFYRKHNPDYIASVDIMLTKYRGKETDMFDRLARQYDTVSPLSRNTHTHLEEKVDYEHILTRFYTVHDTSKISSVKKLLKKFEGKETELFTKLAIKYKTQNPLSRSALYTLQDNKLPVDGNMNLNQNIPTSSIAFRESAHGRMRREQRGLSKKDLQTAVKYGKRADGNDRRNGDTTSVYTYKNIVYITNDMTGEEVTSYALPIVLGEEKITSTMQRQHNKAILDIKANNKRWKSNTVLVVDTSGSMKNCDVWDTRTRLDAVWLSLALDFIAQRIESEGAGVWDVVSIVSLGPYGEVILQEQPTTWVLYNKVVEFYNEKTVKPFSHGMYIPSLDTAEELLNRNKNSSCAMCLLFLSDGKPSDHCEFQRKGVTIEETIEETNSEIMNTVEELAKQFGRRLTFSTIGIGSSDEFDTLRRMVDAASDYGVQASFQLPSRSSSAIGTAFSSVASTITSTQTELTDLSSLHQREVRSVIRESRRVASLPITHVNTQQFYIYKPANIRRKVYKEWYEDRKRVGEYEDAPLQNPEAKYVAFSRAIFGEGAERFAYRFFELAADGRTIVGRPLVAKESRHVLEHDGKDRRQFVKQFCETQQFARRIAEEFNAKLDSIVSVDRRTPRVNVLDCSIYHLKDNILGDVATLVEPRLDHNKWHKWNANNGYVEGMAGAPKLSEADLEETEELHNNRDLGAIVEGSEDEEESDSEDEFAGKPIYVYSASEVAQAFSHFSYWATGRKRLICDLQGVYDERARVMMLSDPVMHYYNHRRKSRQNVHGMTDRGKKGINMFFATHECSRLCSHMINGFKDANRRHHRR